MIRFTKMHGAGNDYVYVCCFDQPEPTNPTALARAISPRRTGVGSDGLILILPSKQADARMRMFNVDGSESAMCGNGIRCVAKYVYDHGLATNESLRIETGNGVLSIDLTIGDDGLVQQATVDMGPPILEPAAIPTSMQPQGPIVDFPLCYRSEDTPAAWAGVLLPATCVSMGNPHCVIFVDRADDDLVQRIGPLIEHDPRFPQRTNVEFVEVINRGEVRQRTWERGSGETWACGTGASAVCVAGVLSGRTDDTILNHLVGGDLRLHWDRRQNRVTMTGGAVEVFSGSWPSAAAR